MATRATTAAKAQTVALPGQDLTASIVTELATAILALDDRLKAVDAQIAMTFAEHPQAAVIQSMPGFGPFLGATLLVGANDLRAFLSAGHLAAAGLVPVPNYSRRHTGNLHRALRSAAPCGMCSTSRPNQHETGRTQPHSPRPQSRRTFRRPANLSTPSTVATLTRSHLADTWSVCSCR